LSCERSCVTVLSFSAVSVQFFVVVCVNSLTTVKNSKTADYRLTEKKQALRWTPEVEAAFQTLQGAVCTGTILAYSQPGESFIVDTDASNCGMGGILSQIQDGEERALAYYSKTLNKTESNCCVTRRELLAIVRTLDHFHKYLYGQQFHLRTDHSALTWLMSFRNQELQTTLWIQRLQEYKFTSKHRQGRRRNNTVALSRQPCQEECTHCYKIETRADVKQI
jgi:hypothetical protein